MSALSSESSSPEGCVMREEHAHKETLLFSAIAQRLKTASSGSVPQRSYGRMYLGVRKFSASDLGTDPDDAELE